jgi:hypothetical protein
MITFFWNGLKVNKGKLEQAYISFHRGYNKRPDEISICAKHYSSFSEEIKKEFTVVNKSDIMTDYFEQDHFTIKVDSKYWNDVLKASLKDRNRVLAKYTKRYSKSDLRSKNYLLDEINRLNEDINYINSIIK